MLEFNYKYIAVSIHVVSKATKRRTNEMKTGKGNGWKDREKNGRQRLRWGRMGGVGKDVGWNLKNMDYTAKAILRGLPIQIFYSDR